ncbi:MAG: hypothetical protein U0360_11765 [Dehalococcoidia bacterium]
MIDAVYTRWDWRKAIESTWSQLGTQSGAQRQFETLVKSGCSPYALTVFLCLAAESGPSNDREGRRSAQRRVATIVKNLAQEIDSARAKGWLGLDAGRNELEALEYLRANLGVPDHRRVLNAAVLHLAEHVRLATGSVHAREVIALLWAVGCKTSVDERALFERGRRWRLGIDALFESRPEP